MEIDVTELARSIQKPTQTKRELGEARVEIERLEADLDAALAELETATEQIRLLQAHLALVSLDRPRRPVPDAGRGAGLPCAGGAGAMKFTAANPPDDATA